MLLILGRTGSGKDYLKKLLQDKEISFVKTYTTRKKRFPDEDTYNFISKEEADLIGDKIAVTNIKNGDTPDMYFARKQDICNKQAIVIDPRGAYEVLEKIPDERFCIVYLESDRTIAKGMAIMRALGNEEDGLIFDKRSADENEEFAEFEALLRNGELYEKYKNVITASIVWNDYKSMDSTVELCEEMISIQ